MLWKYCVREILEVHNLLDYITGSKREPSPSVEQCADWVTKNCKACQQIMLTLEDDPLMGVMHLMEAGAIWTVLCT
jgi:hypothetical protein